MWKMLHAENAIEAMAVTVKFAEPISGIVKRRVDREMESISSAEGLVDRQPIQGIMVDMTNEQGIKQATTGMVYQMHVLTRVGERAPARQLSKQIVILPDHFAAHVHTYRKWPQEKQWLLNVLSKPIETVASAIGLSSVRLEYLDRFIYDGTPDEADLSLVLAKSNLLAGHIFDSSELFHSHTGRFRESTPETRKLEQVNVDCQLLAEPHPNAHRKTIAVMTAVERQYSAPGREIAPESAQMFLAETLESLHTDVLSLFASVLNPTFASENRLPVNHAELS